MKRGFARPTPADPPGFAPAPIELPTPLKVPPPEGKPLWTVVLVIGLIGLVGGNVRGMRKRLAKRLEQLSGAPSTGDEEPGG